MELGKGKMCNGPLAKVHEEQLINKTKVLLDFCDYVFQWSGMKREEMAQDVLLPDQKVTDDAKLAGRNGCFPCRKRYLYDQTLYLLTAHAAEEDGNSVIITLNRPVDNKTATSKMNLSEIPKLKGQLPGVPNWASIRAKLKEELVDTFLNNPPSPPASNMIVAYNNINPPSPPPLSFSFERANSPPRPAETNFYPKLPAPVNKLVELPFVCYPAGATLPPPRSSGRARILLSDFARPGARDK